MLQLNNCLFSNEEQRLGTTLDNSCRICGDLGGKDTCPKENDPLFWGALKSLDTMFTWCSFWAHPKMEKDPLVRILTRMLSYLWENKNLWIFCTGKTICASRTFDQNCNDWFYIVLSFISRHALMDNSLRADLFSVYLFSRPSEKIRILGTIQSPN